MKHLKSFNEGGNYFGTSNSSVKKLESIKKYYDRIKKDLSLEEIKDIENKIFNMSDIEIKEYINTNKSKFTELTFGSNIINIVNNILTIPKSILKMISDSFEERRGYILFTVRLK
jgi:membrane protease subunit (stomatin/prohibitin family)